MSIITAEVFVTLADDLHEFDTLEIKLEPAVGDLTDHVDSPNEKYRGEILSELRNTRMWKAGLNNPNGEPYEVSIGNIIIDPETGDIINKDIEKTSHHSI